MQLGRVLGLLEAGVIEGHWRKKERRTIVEWAEAEWWGRDGAAAIA
jgi:hypothetical protein